MIRVWLAAFVVLFATIELVEWFAQLGSWQPTGMWLVLGGIGLAALSNAAHLSKMAAPSQVEPQLGSQSADSTQTETTGSSEPVAQVAATAKEKIDSQIDPQTAEGSDKDSISFKVRPLKR